VGETTTRIKDLKALGTFADAFVQARRGVVVGLSGGLGAGKTTFVRACVAAIAKATGVAPPRVTSPSFVLHQVYPGLTPPVEHFDLYRLEDLDIEALMNLGYGESVERMRAAAGFLFVEWPEKARDVKLLDLSLCLQIDFEGAGRRITQTS